jgi:hypothetical protein
MAPVYFKVHGTGVLWASLSRCMAPLSFWHRCPVLLGFSLKGAWHWYLGTGISGILALKYFGSAPIAERQMSPKAIAMN